MAKKELTQDITEIGNILEHCSNDLDVIKNAPEIEKYTHKIKGLAPMMGQDEIGQIATLIDKLLKTVASAKSITGVYTTVSKSYKFMRDILGGVNADFESLRMDIEKNHKTLLE